MEHKLEENKARNKCIKKEELYIINQFCFKQENYFFLQKDTQYFKKDRKKDKLSAKRLKDL